MKHRTGTPLSMLIVEDSLDDAESLIHTLAEGGYDLTTKRVDTAEDMDAALDQAPWDVVISDFSLPRFSAPAALAVLQRRGLDVPFIIVSGTVGDEMAVTAMKAGAHDFIAKERLARLLPALERELREGRVRAEQRKMRDQLVISERMASAGTLAAGVAHEINNPLAVVAANLEYVTGMLERIEGDARTFAQRRDGDGDGDGDGEVSSHAWLAWLQSRAVLMAEPLADAREAVERIRNIVQDVKLFSRPQEDARGPVDVRGVIESAIRMSWNEIRHRAQLLKEYGNVPLVDANESRLGQVVLNLLVNAAQAIPEGNAKNNRIRILTRTDARGRVTIEVSDTGQGISPENLERIFDPFFTTKPIGVGTGLGLAICHRIVTDLGGEMDVESEVGKGTLFRVTVPASEARLHESRAPEGVPVTTRRARVLLVDDEIAVGRALQRILVRHHDVTVLHSGKEAVTRLASGERFDVIVSDLMMPEVTGMELHAELTLLAPDQAARMVFVTGGAFTPAALRFLDSVPNPRIDKPLELANLLQIIEQVI
jgi:signal transduction histidine kinase